MQREIAPTDGSLTALNPVEAIDALLARLETTARQAVEPMEFYQAALPDLAAALDASVAVWIETDQGLVRLHGAGPAGEGWPPESEHRLAAAVLAGAAPRLLDPGASVPGTEVQNESARLQCLIPRVAEGAPGLVLRAGLKPDVRHSTRETVSGLLVAAADIALQFQIHHRLRQLHQQGVFWRDLDAAVRAMHGATRVPDCARVIAEHVRYLLGCDRVSVLVRRGRRCRLAAISAAADQDARSRQVRLLQRVANDVIDRGRGLEVHVGGAGSAARMTDVIETYLDESHVRVLQCDPLEPPAVNPGNIRAIGVVAAESYQGANPGEWKERLDLILPHAAQALQRALMEESRGWGRLLSPWRSLSQTAGWLAILGLLTAGAAALAVIPGDFTVEAPGRLMPRDRRGVFAPSDGIVTEVLVDDGAEVRAGQSLVRLSNPELDLEWSRLQGERQTAAAKLAAVQARRRLRVRDPQVDAAALSIEEEELKATVAGLDQQLQVVQQRREQLAVNSPLTGRVARWDVRDVLQSLPVRHGQNLMDVFDPDGPWRLELDVPDDVSGYVRLAQGKGAALPVDFVLQSDPANVLSASLSSLSNATDLNADGKLTVRGTVDLPDHLIHQPRRGATVIAQIHCGQRSLAFIWFREVVEFVYRKILF